MGVTDSRQIGYKAAFAGILPVGWLFAFSCWLEVKLIEEEHFQDTLCYPSILLKWEDFLAIYNVHSLSIQNG